MTLSDAISLIQTVLAIGAFIFAYQEFRKWRVELLGSKKIDLAIRLGKAALEVREAFIAARSPIGYARKDPEYPPNATHDEKYRQDREYDFNTRLQLIQPKLEQLYDIRWEVSVLFGKKDSIEDQIKFYNAKFHELQQAMLKVLYDKGTERQDVILFRGIEGDEFGKAIEENTQKILDFAQRYTL